MVTGRQHCSDKKRSVIWPGSSGARCQGLVCGRHSHLPTGARLWFHSQFHSFHRAQVPYTPTRQGSPPLTHPNILILSPPPGGV